MIKGLPQTGMAFVPQLIWVLIFILGIVIGYFLKQCISSLEQKKEELHKSEINQKYQEEKEELNKQSILAILNAVDLKDRYTKGHSNRVATYSAEIAKRMGKSVDEQNEIYYAGLLHDVGKIGIDNAILNKKGKLTDVEYETVKLHPTMGYQIVKNITASVRMADGAKWHHEKYDGTGYPDHLAGENIPEIARIIALADVYDSMTSNRSYRETMPQSKVRSEIEKGRGTQFDPAIADVMLSMIDDDKEYLMRQMPPDDKKILIIDDDKMSIKVTSHILNSQPEYTSVIANSAEEGIQRIIEHEIALILLDLRMPDIDGFETYQMIRKLGYQMPIVFLTGDNDMELIEKARGIGAEDYLIKPVVPQAMLEIIHAVLEREEQDVPI